MYFRFPGATHTDNGGKAWQTGSQKRLDNTQRALYYWHVVLLAMYENCKQDR